MKRIIFIVLLFSLYACKSKNHQPKYTQQSHQHWIPNWEKDTLVAIGGNAPYMTDVMYSETIGDTSVLHYRGEKYYVWTENVKYEPFKAYYHFSPDQQSYNEVVISKFPFTNKMNEFYLEADIVEPAAYYDTLASNWKEQAQRISLKQMPEGLPVGFRGSYSTANKRYLD